mgnify:CR=1 FL=1
MIWLGRADTQVKVRGFRIEPAEVELAIMRQAERHTGLRGAAVVARRRPDGDAFLAAFLTGEADGVDMADLTGALRAELPAERLELVAAEPVVGPLPVLLGLDQAGVAEHLQVVGHRRLAAADRLDQIAPAIEAGATHLLLDNMGEAALREAVTLVNGRVPTEASGGVSLETIRATAETGVTYVSVGRITQSAPAVDIGLDYSLANSA